MKKEYRNIYSIPLSYFERGVGTYMKENDVSHNKIFTKSILAQKH